jgi:hypothetical protein
MLEVIVVVQWSLLVVMGNGVRLLVLVSVLVLPTVLLNHPQQLVVTVFVEQLLLEMPAHVNAILEVILEVQ